MTVTFLEVVKAACPELSDDEVKAKQKKDMSTSLRKTTLGTLQKKSNGKRPYRISTLRESFYKAIGDERISMCEMVASTGISTGGIRARIRKAGVQPILKGAGGRPIFTITRKEFAEVFGV